MKKIIKFQNFSTRHQIKTTAEIFMFSKAYKYLHTHKEKCQNNKTQRISIILCMSFSKKTDPSEKVKRKMVVDYFEVNENMINAKRLIPNIRFQLTS